MEKWVAQLDYLIVELNLFAKLACHQLDEHLSFEGGMPSVLNIIHPFLTDLPGLKELKRRKIRKQVMRIKIIGYISEYRCPIVLELILILNGHDIIFAHLELYEPVGSVVLETPIKC